jgi:hypothetical protein
MSDKLKPEDKTKHLEDKIKGLEDEVRALRRDKAKLEALLAKSLQKARDMDKLAQGFACKSLGLVNTLAGEDK